ncbi:hypothetical protein LUZ60_015731 [Juncus effusus]|nr:hypothetical protein LUZ60_015731 [Juncus effusus]
MGDKVFVALPDSYDEGRSVLSWVLSHFSSDKTQIIISHIITSPFKGLFDPTPWLIERENMDLVLSKYLSQCSAHKFKAEKLVHVSDDIAEGLSHLIAQNGIKNLVMRAIPNREMNGIVSETGRKVIQEANSSCKIWFVYDGGLIFTREPNTYWLTKPTEQPNQASSSTSASTSSRSNPNSPFQARDLVVVDTTLKEMLNEASVEAVNFQMIANEELTRREQVEKEMFGAYKKSMLLLTKVTEALQLKEQKVRDIEAILERERQEKDVLKREIEELKQANSRQGEIEQLQRENDQLKRQQDENLNLILAANEKKLSLERQISDYELIVKDLQIISASSGDQLDSLQTDYNKLYQEKEDVFKELRRQREDTPSGSGSSSNNSEFSMQELDQATRNFSALLKIGEGGFGWVYKGSLRGTTVAIKMLRSQNLQSIAQFQQEVTILTKVRHPNLVTLMGACSEASALIYEYLSNGSLEDRLQCANDTPPLTWQVRTRIIGEICLALIFLHSNKPQLVVHGDLKPENILLDANLVSKLSDFGIAKLLKQHNPNTTAFYQTSNPGGTFAYSDPEFLATGILTTKSDVYSFGIIVLRLITGKPPLNIVRQVEDAMSSNGRFQNVIDESAGRWPVEEAKKLAKIGLRCADFDRSRRPNMVNDVWKVVEPLMKAASESAASGTGLDDQVPSQFICPIYQEIMEDPHIAADGFTYEGEAIMRWLNSHNTSPMTNLALPHQNVIQNITLRSTIQDWLQKHPQT